MHRRAIDRDPHGRAGESGVVATGSLVREAGHGSFHIPSELNAHGSFRQTYRTGDGVARIGAGAFSGEGLVGTVSWRDHVNG